MFGHSTCPTSIIKAYNGGDYSDLTITCGSMVFTVHKLVVCTKCAFFEKSAKFGKEAEENRIDLPEDDPEMIRRLIAYLYLGDYEPCYHTSISNFRNMKQPESRTELATTYHARYTKALFDTDLCACLALGPGAVPQKKAPRSDSVSPEYKLIERPDKSVEIATPLSVHATMYALGDKYHVDGLCQLATSKFDSCLHYHWNSEDFIDAVQIVYSSTPDTNRGLRDVVLKAFNIHFGINIAQIPGLEMKLHTIDEMSFHLMKSWPKKASLTPQSAQKPPVASSSLFASFLPPQPVPGGPSPQFFAHAQPPRPASGNPQPSLFASVQSQRPVPLFGGSGSSTQSPPGPPRP
ncbi:hypothetical protein P153DRAFT_380535 [Dothidotthia symphoricarpi CBS 119687]|uniref:BTB domain-containing protein n=1 Tax=Dothidotthia symphoricarpi CBS 119687 TaxID=1392245 RepID=A0A6A6AU41_9PLEO|nr:uncharacterized protein P153DRAFT_380535 [Dothidotthia symphoricarpi CBS 119687]KAF2134723.1 hypothetical protein P153DRAFT_380535 [Dothidotthia symphoricarpi CBS 119687]